MTERSCKNCEWWMQGEVQGYGQCRRYPPKLQSMTNSVFGGGILQPMFPDIAEGVWCGEFKERPAEQEKIND